MTRLLPYMLLAAVLFSACSSTPPADVREYPVQISNLGGAVNTERDEFSPSVTANGQRLVFTRGNTSMPFDRDFYESALDGEFWMLARRLPDRINSATNEGSPSFSADGQTLYFAATDRDDSQGKSDLYVSTIQGREWQEARNIGFPVNTTAWESHPSTTADGRTVYFASDRPGGLGGLDIWMTWRDDAGMWRVPVNLGAPVNTDGDELSPCIARDGKTLYFASDGHAGLGGTDMFVSRLIGERWSQPTNVGKPLNSEGDDEFFSLAAEGSIVFFSSRRDGGFGGYDLYRAEPNPFPPGAVIVLSGTVRDARTRTPLGANIRVVDESTQREFVSLQSNAYSGEYVVVLPAGAVYRVTAEAAAPYKAESERFDFLTQSVYGEVTHDFLLRKDEPTVALDAAVSTDLRDFSVLSGDAGSAGLTIEEYTRRETLPLLPYVFFAEGSADIPSRYVSLTPEQMRTFDTQPLPDETLARYHHFLNILGSRMTRHGNASVTLTGCTDGSEHSTLGRSRAEAVARYLRDVWGIAEGRISVQGRGLPAAPSSSRSPEGREENRRVEIASSDPALLLPIEIEDVQQVLKPTHVRFFPSITAEAGLERWRFEVREGERVLRDADGFTTYPDSIPWNWRDYSGALPKGNEALVFTLYAKDKRGGEVTTAPQRIPVSFVSLEKKQLEQLPDKTVEKISLILFDFDRSEMGAANEMLLERVAPRLTERSTILVRGFTDRLGSEEYNKALSERRAASVKEALAKRIRGRAMRSEGVGESLLLFDNALPEGRFYCRTVQILIETTR
ncbi:MAG TPA: OmpA family protein [Bacteroidota bacterium]|nr:OmpA family protein [Bacteroidota bacterium]